MTGGPVVEPQTAINLVGGTIIGLFGWIGKAVWDGMKELRQDLHSIEVELPRSYVGKNEYSATMTRIELMFQRIEDKLDDKADKP